MRKVSIITIGGFIGHYLYGHLRGCGHFEVGGSYYEPGKTPFLDILNKTNLEHVLPEFNNGLLILLGALKDVKKCEENHSLAYATNTESVNNIISIIKRKHLNIKLIYFSSDYVFDGTKGNYKPTDELKPRTVYGKTKMEAEKLLIRSGIEFKIIRTSAVIGKGSPFFDWIVTELGKDGPIELYSNVYFSPTPITFLCDMVTLLMKYWDDINDRILHIVGEKKLSRLEFAKIIKERRFPESKAQLMAKILELENSIFQSNLSMIQSDVIAKEQSRDFVAYLDGIV